MCRGWQAIGYLHSKMRKLHTLRFAAAAVICATLFSNATMAQTTFATSNNPEASIEVNRIDNEATIVTISQDRRSSTYVQVSQNTVIKDRETGIAYMMTFLESSVDPDTYIETQRLTFRPFLDGATSFELLDPRKVNENLYFSRVEHSCDSWAYSD
jgi:hypothetical protein